jgi:OOP family OmpA-OmpF porin
LRLVLIVMLIAFLIPAIVVDPVDAGCKEGCKGTCCTKKSDMEVTEFIYDVTIPWPFRQHPKGDEDGDGVFDALDKCPGTPRGAIVDDQGCPMDTDGDGVYDGIDDCPGTPKGAKVDKRGCPMDTDGDGVPDGIDRCPNTPAGTTVDQWGCTAGETEFLDTGVFTTSDILFAISKLDIEPESYPLLDRIGNSLVQWSKLKIEIGGYTDSSGSADFNQKLSEQRAQAVLDYLVKKFPEIERQQFTAKGYGENNPIATNDTKEGRAKNRRVEFKVLNKEQLKRQKQ